MDAGLGVGFGGGFGVDRLHRQGDEELMVHDTPVCSWRTLRGCVRSAKGALMVTVEIDPVCVESRLSAGELRCPVCPLGVLGGWGHARARSVVGGRGRVRPRRARCRDCSVTQVLLPVSLLLRRGYLAELIWAAVVARSGGAGHRRIAVGLGVPASTVRGWLRRMADRLEAVRIWFISILVMAGVDVEIPKAAGSGWADAVAAVGAAGSVIVGRFGRSAPAGAVTAAGVAVAGSGGRLLAPGWPGVSAPGGATRAAPDAAGVHRESSRR